MDSDFRFKRPSATGASSDVSTDAVNTSAASIADSTPTDSSRQVADAQQMSTAGIVTSNKPKKGHGLLVFFVMLLLVIAAAAGVYYWQHDKVVSLRTANVDLNTKVNALVADNAKRGALPLTSEVDVNLPEDVTDIITESPLQITATSALVGVMFSHAATQAWIDSGTSPDKLSETNPKVSPIPAASDEVEYLKNLNPNTTYYYRAMGTVDGKTVFGGITSFHTSK